MGLEGTAHTISCGILTEREILGQSSRVFVPKVGGIHPREAAIHHADNVQKVMAEAFERSKVSPGEIDLVAFSKGPGLGPCLRVTATAARAFALKFNKPILGVNHPLGHVEIGRRVTGAIDPIMLYVSGGNTQVISHVNGRYRVLGETMDIGLGNLIDKVARDLGIPFPGGPVIERLAKEGSRLFPLPYSVKGMDTSFSGIYTAIRKLISEGHRKEDIAYSLQETAFPMVVEILERGIHQTNKQEILLAGGVARNLRLRDMIGVLASELGLKAFLTTEDYCMDNGIMIAQAGLLMFQNGFRENLEQTRVDQRFRIDQVSVPWIHDRPGKSPGNKGAEAYIIDGTFNNRNVVLKRRNKKSYRNPELDMRLISERTRNELTLLKKLADIGIPVPTIYDYDPGSLTIVMEKVEGKSLRNLLPDLDDADKADLIRKVANHVAVFHENGLAHGDLTASNILVSNDGQIKFIDTSLGKIDSSLDDLGVDLFLFRESLSGVNGEDDWVFLEFLKEYSSKSKKKEEIRKVMDSLENRRRYV
ncbi:MAG TPA: bifunctional N(6)-L-threonylcarbamoyladenine synthase/serine/threonine protein kinase [Thermoplasmataceae archaeon]|nr:bifunctional N(6)-L-threonylcarbamoyladenine synthase/serine/threonine protein kinase [Thermoplasmataceae archaeon]